MATGKYWIWLATRKGVRPVDYLLLLHHFGTAEAIYLADRSELDAHFSLLERGKNSLADKELGEVEEILSDCDRLNLRVMTYADGDYPDRLKQLPDAPLVLYIRGKWIAMDEMLALSIVGPRKCSSYGVQVADEFAYGLAKRGAVVVSGMAQGIDGTALRACMRAGGFPVSVVGNGVDVVYPRENASLYEDVAARGMLLSEYPPGTPPIGDHFPLRNRILSGLSLGTLIVEAAERSGALITARLAVEQNRDCFVIPGNIYAPTSAGTNRLLSRGEGRAVRSVEDILSEYVYLFPDKLRDVAPLSEEQVETIAHGAQSGEISPQQEKPLQKKLDKSDRLHYISYAEAVSKRSLTDDQIMILQALENKRYNIDEITDLTQIPAKRVMTALTHLELDDYVRQMAGKRYEALLGIEAER